MATTSINRLCIVMPAYKEAARIAPAIRDVLGYCPNIVVIDDGSEDGTAEAAEEAGATVLRHSKNLGKGAALDAGIKYAREKGFEVLITMDSDGQHDPREIPKFFDTYVETGTPVLVGNRMGDVDNMPTLRKWTNRIMSKLLDRIMKQEVPDTQCGCRLYQCDVFPDSMKHSRGYAAESEVLLELADRGVKIGSVSIASIYGDEKSKINPISDTVRFFTMLRRYRKRRKQETGLS